MKRAKNVEDLRSFFDRSPSPAAKTDRLGREDGMKKGNPFRAPFLICFKAYTPFLLVRISSVLLKASVGT